MFGDFWDTKFFFLAHHFCDKVDMECIIIWEWKSNGSAQIYSNFSLCPSKTWSIRSYQFFMVKLPAASSCLSIFSWPVCFHVAARFWISLGTGMVELQWKNYYFFLSRAWPRLFIYADRCQNSQCASVVKKYIRSTFTEISIELRWLILSFILIMPCGGSCQFVVRFMHRI